MQLPVGFFGAAQRILLQRFVCAAFHHDTPGHANTLATCNIEIGSDNGGKPDHKPLNSNLSGASEYIIRGWLCLIDDTLANLEKKGPASAVIGRPDFFSEWLLRALAIGRVVGSVGSPL